MDGAMTDCDRVTEVLSSLQYLFEPGQVIEIRTISGDGISSGYFDDLAKATTEILEREKDFRVSGIYATLNEVNPALLARRANRIKVRLERKDASTADADIIRRHWLPIDIDPVRPSGVSSSDEEHETALSLAKTIRSFLVSCGWPDPLMADSGNGAHLLYPVDLPNDDDSRNLIRNVLEILDIRFSHARCKVDTANFNAARIWKVYGTISRKGDNLQERPHRRSRILFAPPIERVLSADDISQFISTYPVHSSEPDVRHKGRTRTSEAIAAVSEHVLDLAKWLRRYGLTYIAKPYQSGTLYVLDSCPFSTAHTDGAFAIQFENGAIFAGCHHDSCGGGTQRWPELRARFEPVYKDPEKWIAKVRSDRIRAKIDPEVIKYAKGELKADSVFSGHGYAREAPDPFATQSFEILSTGDPLSFLLETFGRQHEGDRQVAQCLIHSLISRIVLNSKGLHVSISGESGKGKSHAMDTMRSLIPPEFRIEGRVSDKALFYMEDLKAGTVITLDDVGLSDQMQEILKGVTTSFQKPFPYRTVNKDRKPQICIIPERCVWWLAKVEGVGDDQVYNRMLTCWIDDTDDQDHKVLDRTLSNAGQLPDSSVESNNDISVCQGMWEDLRSVWVVIPYATNIRFQSAENRRNPDMLLDLIRTNAAIFQHQREKKVLNDVVCIVATIDDFDQAARLFMGLNGEVGGQANKLTKREAVLVSALSQFSHSEVTVSQLQRATGWTSSQVSKLLHGYTSRGKLYSGLLEKCPAVSFLDRTVSKGDEGYTTMRRTTVYMWDQYLYDAWVKGGSVWLVTDPDKMSGSDDPDDRTRENDSGIKTVKQKDGGNTQGNREDGLISRDLCISDDSLPLPDNESGCSFESINPYDFTRIAGFPEYRSCSVCGKGQVHYKKRRSAVQNANSSDEHQVLCLTCYNRAVSRRIASIVTIPGVINPDAMIRREVYIGTCDVCGLNPATMSDPVSRTKICESCYNREKLNADSTECASDRQAGPP